MSMLENYQTNRSVLHSDLSVVCHLEATFSDLIKVFGNPIAVHSPEESREHGLPEGAYNAWHVEATIAGIDHIIPILIHDHAADPNEARYAGVYNWTVCGIPEGNADEISLSEEALAQIIHQAHMENNSEITTI